jgi:transposase-like protein
MPAPRKFDDETRARAVRLYQDRLRDHSESQLAVRRHVGALLDINPATIRNWVEADERPNRSSAPSSVSGSGAEDAQAELRRLRQENAELRRANDILKTASAFFAQAELDRRLK